VLAILNWRPIWLIIIFATTVVADAGRTLSDLATGRAVSLRLKDDQVIEDVELTLVDAAFISYRNQSLSIRLERSQVYRARQNDMFYSDLPLSTADHYTYGTFTAYMQDRGDVIVDNEGTTYIGTIVAQSDASLSIRTRAATYDIAKSKITAWRKDGVSYGDLDSKMTTSGGLFRDRDPSDRAHKIDYSVFISGPWGILPQLGLGLATNANWPMFGGFRAGVGYVALENIGINAQVSAFLNANLWSFSEGNRLYAGAGYLWRASYVSHLTYSSPNSALRSYERDVYGDAVQNTCDLHLGLKYSHFLIEVGIELPIRYSLNISKPAATSSQDIANQQLAAENISRTFDSFKNISQVHFLIAFLF